MERVLKNRFLVEEKLGESPFRISYKAKDLSTGNPLVLKVFRRSPGSEKKIEQILAKLRILQNLQDSVFPRTEDVDYGWEGFYVLREYVEGETLQERLARGARVTDQAILQWTDKLAAGLQKVHAQGLIHAAIHLQNVVFTKNGDIKLVDFMVDSHLRENPVQGVRLLERDPFFLSPEEILGEPPTPGSDVYKLGVLLYRLWTGRFPFEEGNAYQVGLAILKENAKAPSDINGHIAPTPSQMIVRSLAKSPWERFRTVTDLAESIRTGVVPKSRPSRDLPAETEALLQQLARPEKPNGTPASSIRIPSPTTSTGKKSPSVVGRILWSALSFAIGIVAAYFFYRFLFLG